MNLALRLFVMFFKIGMFCFGGGYAMVGVIGKELLADSFMTATEYANIVAISQVTPGPLAINVATYVGAILGKTPAEGIFISAVATIGVCLPSFILIFIIAKFFKTFGQSSAVQKIMGGIRPSVIGLIAGAAILFAELSIVNFDKLRNLDFAGGISIPSLIIAVAVLIAAAKTKFNPMWLLLASGVVGIFIF